MDISIIMSAVAALAVGLIVGWLATKAHADQIRADLIEERRELDIELSAARQQLVQESHWREECELLNNELRSLRDINASLEADLREVTTRLESTQLHAEDKIRQMVNSEQRLSEQFENLANRIFEHSNRRPADPHPRAAGSSRRRAVLSCGHAPAAAGAAEKREVASLSGKDGFLISNKWPMQRRASAIY